MGYDTVQTVQLSTPCSEGDSRGVPTWMAWGGLCWDGSPMSWLRKCTFKHLQVRFLGAETIEIRR